MPKPIVRIGDRFAGVCFNHSVPQPVQGNVTSTPQNFSFDEGKLIAVETAQCVANCGHIGQLISSSSLTLVGNFKVGLLGDRVIGQGIQGVIISGSSLTNSD